MKKILVLMAIFASIAILAGCASADSQGGDITGKVWVLDSLNSSPPVAGTVITAEFTAEGQVAGTAGCNRYMGQYTVSGSTIQFPTPVASTMMACDGPVMDQETAYFQALASAKSFAVKEDQLTLKDSGGKAVATFKAQSQDLSGTSWLTVNYNNGRQAVVGVLAGTELTANFAKDGTLSGSAGCNNFTGTYKVDGNKITIGPLASTMMACSDPAGVMEQETEYLAALQSAATYSMEGNQLELRTADDAMAALFNQK